MDTVLGLRSKEITNLHNRIANYQERQSRDLALINAQTEKIQGLNKTLESERNATTETLRSKDEEIAFLQSCLDDLGVNYEAIREDPQTWQRAPKLVSVTVEQIEVGDKPEFTNKFQIEHCLRFLSGLIKSRA